MNCTFMPSLKQTCLVKITTILWNQYDIRTLMGRIHFPSFDREEKWLEIEKKVMRKVSNLLLPETLKNEILGIIRPIGFQILGWMRKHVKYDYLRLNMPSNLCWTSVGTVDRKKTAEVLVKDESLDIKKRYKLACMYCLHNDIRLLWDKIPEDHKKSVGYSEKYPVLNHEQIVIFWSYYLKGEVGKLDYMISGTREATIHQLMFECEGIKGREVSAEYFLSKITPEEREDSFSRIVCWSAILGSTWPPCSFFSCIHKQPHVDVLFFMLSQMHEEQRMTMLKCHSYSILVCLLDWPFQHLFMETAELLWNFLSEEEYDCLLLEIVDKIVTDYRDYNYPKLFRLFWQQSPDSHKKYAIHKCDLLLKLFKAGSKENIRFILKDTTTEDREKIIFCNNGKDVCKNLIYHKKWKLLQCIVGECLSSKSLIIKFKEELKEHITNHISREAKKALKRKRGIWSKCFKLLDNLVL